MIRLSIAAVLVCWTVYPAHAQTYWQDIHPVFRKHCTVCHSAKNLKEADVSGGLALDTFEAAKKGSSKAIVVPGKSGASALYQLIVTTDIKKRMPLDAKPLPQDSVDLIKKWIDAGAPEGTPATDANLDPVIAKKSGATHKLDVLLPTSAIPPAGLFKANPAKLDLALKIGPLAPVAAVALSPDNKLLATGSYGQVAIWDLNAGKPLRVLTNVLGAVNDLEFSPDGNVLAVAGGQPSAKGDLRLYQVGDWKLLGVLRGHDDVVFSIAFSRDGKRLLSASFDHTVRLWDQQAQTTLATFSGHSDFVTSVAFSPDGTQFISGSKDRSVRLVDTATGKSLFTMSDRDEDVLAVAFHPDGKQLVASGYEPRISWWNPKTGEKNRTSPGHGVAVHELAFSEDGKRLISAAADRTVRVWDGVSGNVLNTLAVGSIVYAAAISSDNKCIATGSFDGLTKLWDEKSGRHLATLLALPGDADQPDWLALTPEGYAAGSDKMLALAKWRMSGQEIAATAVWTALRQPELVTQAVRGEALPAPKFPVDKK
ncbi:MAG: hypothetical protein L0215_09230 [Gemmataceae bacterium]|nr:hypothetical protein [Gemmataceae bacterium]